jgi:hypothetical protein
MKLAKNSGFIKRVRNILPDTIVKVFVFGLVNVTDPSLLQIASKCEDFQPNLSISKNAIYKKLQSTSQLLQNIFAEAMMLSIKKTLRVKHIEILSHFKDVKVCDSTKISLPDKLKDLWPGLGGCNAKSSLKIQGVYSLLSSCFSTIEIMKAPGNDTTYSEKLLSLVNKDELLITDLGYYSIPFFKKLSAKGAYFLSRVRSNCIVFQEQNGKMEHLNLNQILDNRPFVDEEVFLGYRKLTACRLVATRLPENIINDRRRKANKKARSSGSQVTKDETKLLAYNIIITNAKEDKLPAEVVFELYRARWQIELIFKCCKSHLKLARVSQCGRYQLECLIYGRLIAAVFFMLFYNDLYLVAYSKFNRGLSILKFTKLLAEKFITICKHMSISIDDICAIKTILANVSKHSLYEKRSKKTTIEILQEYSFT